MQIGGEKANSGIRTQMERKTTATGTGTETTTRDPTGNFTCCVRNLLYIVERQMDCFRFCFCCCFRCEQVRTKTRTCFSLKNAFGICVVTNFNGKKQVRAVCCKEYFNGKTGKGCML